MKFKILILLLICSLGLSAQINSNAFATKVDFSLGTPTSTHFADITDVDGDGKKDIIALHHNATSGTISVFLNTATPGIIDNSSLATRHDISTFTNTLHIVTGDLDGDGKTDMVTNRFFGTATAAHFSWYRNTSIVGSVSYDIPVHVTLPSSMSGMALRDMDGDGKLDLIGAMYHGNAIRIYRNNSTTGTISFDTINYTSISTGTGSWPSFLAAEDYDGDGKFDFAISCTGTASVKVFRNMSSLGVISISSALVLTSGASPSRIAAGDIDRDGLKDILIANNNAGTVGIYKNTSTSGSLGFNAAVTFSTVNTNGPLTVQAADFDNDGKLDMALGNFNQSSFSVWKNFGANNVINSTTMGSRKQFTSILNPELYVDDIDADGKTDVVTCNRGGTSISIFRNKIIPSNGLVAYYPFSNNAGDSSGYENHGTSNGVTSIADRNQTSGSAYNFDGVNDRVSVAANPAFNVNGFSNIMFSCWVNPALGTFSPATRRVFHMIDGAGNAMEINYNYGTNKFEYINWDHSIQVAYILNPAVTSARQTWHHVAVRIDSTNKTTMFINGLPQGTMNSVPVKPTNALFDIGRHTAQGWYFAGGIDEVRINSNYVSDYEILRMVNSTAHYYTKSSGDINVLSTWGENTDGTGPSPLNFDSSNVTYHITNNTSPSMSGNLSINGTGSVLVFGDGSNSYNLTVPALNAISCDSMYVNSNITLTVMGGLTSTKLGSAASSTVQYLSPTTQNIAGGVYENLVIGMSTKTLTSHTQSGIISEC